MVNKPILRFRPWVCGRTTLYEYFCMSWATRAAAERTTYPPLAARLVGESFELSVKALHVLCRGVGRDLPFGHSLSEILADIPQIERILREFSGDDLGSVDNWVAIRRVPCYMAAMHAGTAAQAREQVT